MNTLILNENWTKVSKANSKDGYRILRLTADALPNIFIGENDKGYRCVLLYPNCSINLTLKDTDKEYISLSYSKKHNVLIITLKDIYFADVFDQFIISTYHNLKNIDSDEKSVKEFVSLFKKWVEFFKSKAKNRLSLEEIRGLFGELTAIKFLFQEDQEVNEILKGWRGPFGSHHDLILSQKQIEVKSITQNNQPVKISSEYQLESDNHLEMWVIQLESNTIEGKSIKEIIEHLLFFVQTKKADVSLFLSALLQLGLTIDNLSEYDNIRYVAKKIKIYDCCSANFPKLIRSEIPKEIIDIKYTIITENLDNCLLREIKLKYDN